MKKILIVIVIICLSINIVLANINYVVNGQNLFSVNGGSPIKLKGGLDLGNYDITNINYIYSDYIYSDYYYDNDGNYNLAYNSGSGFEVYAYQYCDESGSYCFYASDVGSGGGDGEYVYADYYYSRDSYSMFEYDTYDYHVDMQTDLDMNSYTLDNGYYINSQYFCDQDGNYCYSFDEGYYTWTFDYSIKTGDLYYSSDGNYGMTGTCYAEDDLQIEDGLIIGCS